MPGVVWSCACSSQPISQHSPWLVKVYGALLHTGWCWSTQAAAQIQHWLYWHNSQGNIWGFGNQHIELSRNLFKLLLSSKLLHEIAVWGEGVTLHCHVPFLKTYISAKHLQYVAVMTNVGMPLVCKIFQILLFFFCCSFKLFHEIFQMISPKKKIREGSLRIYFSEQKDQISVPISESKACFYWKFNSIKNFAGLMNKIKIPVIIWRQLHLPSSFSSSFKPLWHVKHFRDI